MTISIDELERVAADGWRATEQTPLGDWVLRSAAGFTGRANSALAVGDPGMPLAQAIDHVRQWYAARGQPAMVAVGYPLGRPEESPVDVYLAEHGWSVHHGAIVMTVAPGAIGAAGVVPVTSAIAAADGAGAAGAAGAVPLPPDGPVRVEVTDEPGDGWLALYRYRGGVPPPISRRLLVSAPWQAFASARVVGRTVAIGRVAASRGWAGLTAIEVDPAHRRRGLGRVITAALVTAAADHGGNGTYLQVENDNQAARALYQGMGFTEHHGYHYRIEPPAPNYRGCQGAASLAGSYRARLPAGRKPSRR